MNILWFGDTADTGFGSVTSAIGNRLLAMGHDVRFLMQNMTWWPHGNPDMVLRSGNLQLMPPGDLAQLLTNGMPEDGWQPEVVVFTADYGQAVRQVAGITDQVFKAFRKLGPNRLFHYVPIEGTDLSPGWGEFWKEVTPIAMSDFGAREISKVTGKPTTRIYHGVDQGVFHPLPLAVPAVRGVNGREAMTFASKREAKLEFGLNPDHTVLLKTDRHMPRKNYDLMLHALGPLLGTRDNVDLVIHCATNDQAGILEDEIRKYERTWPSAIQHVFLTSKHNTWRGLAPVMLSALYNAGDVYVSCSSEGFGLCPAEAVACGVPAVGLDYSAVPEVIGPAGLLTKVGHEVYNVYNHKWAVPDEDDLLAKVTQLVDDPALRAELGAKGPAHIAKLADWDVAAQQFSDVFTSAQLEAAA